MKKKRQRKPPPDRHSLDSQPGSETPNGRGASHSLVRYAPSIFLVALLAYLLFYFTAPAPGILQDNSGENAELTRIDMALWLVKVQLPSLWQSWTGGDVGNISIIDRIFVLSIAMLFLLVASIIGWLLLDVTHAARGLARLELAIFSLAVGINALSLLTLSIGLLGQLQNLFSYVTPVGLLLIAAGMRFYVEQVSRSGREEHETRTGRKTCSTKGNWLSPLALWLGAPFVLIILAGAMLPPREFDVREYHLQAPKEWFQQGAITFLPHNIYANMPLGAQVLSLPAMAITPGEDSWWWGALVGKVLIAIYVPLTALALFTAGRRFFSATAGVAAALAYISIPWMAHVSMETYVDGALACNLFLAFYAAMIAINARREGEAPTEPYGQGYNSAPQERRPPDVTFAALAGFLAGAAVSCKYTGLVFVVVPLLALLLFAEGARATVFRKTLTHAAIFLITLLLGCGLWFGKNWALTGSPTYPLLYNVFGGQTRTAEKDAQWRSAHAVPTGEYGDRYSPRQIGAAVERIAVSSDWISPLLLPLAGFALFAPQHRRRILIPLALLLYILAAWFLLTHRIDRFWIPMLPLAALLTGVGVTAFDGPWWRRVMIGVLFWGLAWNFLVITGMLAPAKLFVQLESLQNDRPRVHPAHIWLNEHVPQRHAVLLVGDAQPFDLNMPSFYNTCFDDCIFEQLVKDKTRDQRIASMRERNISHIFVQWSEIDRYRSPGNYGYTDYVTEEVLKELVTQGVLKSPLGQKIEGTNQPNRWIGEIYPVATEATPNP